MFFVIFVLKRLKNSFFYYFGVKVINGKVIFLVLDIFKLEEVNLI